MCTTIPSTLDNPQANNVDRPPKKGRFIVNLFANIANFSLSILVGLWLTPYLIRHLGVAAYGLVPLAVMVTSYLGLFTTALNSAVGRFITMATDRHDQNEANCIFNTSFWGTAAMLLILIGPSMWLSAQASLFFNVPVGYEEQIVWLFLCTIGVFFLTTLASPFGVATYCHNRFDLSNAVSITITFVKVSAILLLFNLYVPRVWHVGLAMVISTVAGLALSIIVWRYLMPTLKVQRSAFSRQALTQLTGMGGWMVINQIGALLFLSIDLVVVNKMVGSEACGQYGAIMMWSIMLRSLAGVVAGVFGPTIISLYGRQDTLGLVAYSVKAVKFVGLMIALPIGLICGLAQPLLRIWLGPTFEPLAPLMVLMSIHLCVNLAVLPLFNIQVAANHVRLPGILTCVMGVGNLGLALLLSGSFGWGMYGVAAAGAVMLTAKNIVFTPLYGAHILGLSYRTFYREIIPVIGTTLALTGAGWWLAKNLQLHTWLGLGVTGLGLVGVFILVTYHLLLTSDERGQALSLVLPREVVPTP
jgi:membrane protein EpsK